MSSPLSAQASYGVLGGMSSSPLAPAQRKQTLMEQAYQKYPRLKNYGFQFVDSTGRGGNGRMLETYPADETDNPMPGKPTIELFSPNATAEDIMGEHLHILPKVDPQIGSMRQQFIESMTPDQNSKLLQQYQHAQQNFGESRPFNQWRDVSGHDAWFRGAVTGQWPADLYTQEQLGMFDKLKGYLGESP